MAENMSCTCPLHCRWKWSQSKIFEVSSDRSRFPLPDIAADYLSSSQTAANACSDLPLRRPLSNTMSSTPLLRAAILIISETASKDPSTDKGIPTLQQVFNEKAGDQWRAGEAKIVPDSVLDIQHAITTWTDGADPVNLIVTSGGTGFAQKDVTPEVSIHLTISQQDRGH